MDQQISDKTNRILNIILLGLLLIFIRVWYLGVIQRDEHVENARKPQRRTVIERVERATIRDRFNIPLALNKIQYNAAIRYADIRHIPNLRWETDAQGKRIRVQPRIEYIKKLADLLGRQLKIDPQKIEDIIHGKASLFPHTPFIIKENLTEKEYYRLKMLEKDWIGICAERSSLRYYPKSKVASDIIGFMGAISSKEYYSIAEELSSLHTYLSEREAGNTPMLPKGFHNPNEVRERVKLLEEKAYTINDSIGKAGVEANFDSELRGYTGKKTYEIDIKGNIVRQLPGSRKSIPGQRLILSISSELQEYAEQLLTEHEKERETRDKSGAISLDSPWIKGGAIVAMDPKTGEVLALASYPRVDLNDFIPLTVHHEQKKQSNLNKWLENETYIGDIWDGKRLLQRERFDTCLQQYSEEEMLLTWEKYCQAILSPECAALEAIHKIASVKDALFLQQETEKLLCASKQSDMRTLFAALYSQPPHNPFRSPIEQQQINTVVQELANNPHLLSTKQVLDHYLGAITANDDKLLVLDLCRMLVHKESFTPQLANKLDALSLGDYRALAQAEICIRDFLYTQMKNAFHTIDFQQWRTHRFKEFLKEKRKEEREKKHYARPYTEYLDIQEKQDFKEFWSKYRCTLMHCFIFAEQLSTDPHLIPYIQQCMQWRNKSSTIKQQADFLKQTLNILDRQEQLCFLKTIRSFQELNRPLLGHYRSLRNTNHVQLEKHLAAAFYPLNGFGFGRSQAFRQATPLGSVFKIVVAYQALLERFESLWEKNQQLTDINPLTLIDDMKWHPKNGSNEQILGYTLDGQVIRRMYKGGQLPRGHPNVGKIDIVGAIEQSSNLYFAILAAEHIRDPLNLIYACREFGLGEKSGIELPGEFAGGLPNDISYNLTALYAYSIGQHSLLVTPLQTATMLCAIANHGKLLKPSIVKVIAGCQPLREYRDPFSSSSYPFQEALSLVGIDFPLFTATQPESQQTQIWYGGPQVRRNVKLPQAVRSPIMQGMHQVLCGAKGTARPELIRSLYHNPKWKSNYLNLKNQLVGKTGTAEILFKQTLDAQTPAKIHNHIWFAGITSSTCPDENFQELAVVVYLRFSQAGGKEAAPLAAEIIKKWQEICRRQNNTSAS